MKNNVIKILSAMLCLVLLLGVSACAASEVESTDAEDDAKNVYAVKYNGTTVELGKKADSVLKKLGEPVSQLNTGNCGGLGETVRYDYSSLVVVVVDYEDGDALVDKIELKTDAAETAHGIYIGASEEDVIAAYGEGEVIGGSRVYRKNDKELAFGIENGKVSTIVLRCI